MRRFAFWGSATLSTSTHRHYDENVHRIKQHTRGNNTIPYHKTLVTFETRQQRAHCYPRRVATVLSRQHFATSLLARWQLTNHRHQVVSTGDMKGGSRPHPSHSTKGKTVRAHCQYTSDRQYNYNITSCTINTFISRFRLQRIILHYRSLPAPLLKPRYKRQFGYNSLLFTAFKTV